MLALLTMLWGAGNHDGNAQLLAMLLKIPVPPDLCGRCPWALEVIPIDWSVAAQARLALSAVFVLSAVGKLSPGPGRAGFRTAVEAFGLIPPRWSRLAVVLVIGAEGAVAIALWPAASSRGALAAAAGMLLLFGALLWRGVRRGVAVPCACFGPSRSPVRSAEVWRNLLLAAIASVGAVRDTAPTALLAGPAASAVDRSLVAAAVAVLAAGFADYSELFTRRGAT
jgi:Methylamine utilisation protein MauE